VIKGFPAARREHEHIRLETKRGHYERILPKLSAEERTLNGVWTLEAPGPNGVVADVEELCVAVLAEMLRRRGMTKASASDRADALGFLLAATVLLHRKYDCSKRHGSGSFSGYLYDRLRFRLIDYWRSPASGFGRQGQHRVGWRPPILDGELQPGGTLNDPVVRRDARAGALDEPVASGPGDDPDDWLATCGGLLEGGDRTDDEPLGVVRVGPDRGAEGRAARAPAVTSAYVDCSCGWRTYRQAPNGLPGWHWPDACSGCGGALLEGVAA
jgi:hypothetical protein